MGISFHSLPLLCAVLFALVGCGGSAGDASAPSLAERTAAAKATAESATNDCAGVRPFYWEVGDSFNSLASGAVNSASSSTVYSASSVMSIASASKWLYGSYYAQRTGGALSAEDVKFLTFRSGYTNFTICPALSTVAGCLQFASNGDYTAATDGLFYYGGGHMQKHAAARGLGTLSNRALADELRSQLGTEVEMNYVQPQLAGGVETSAEQYAKVLRKILTGQLRMRELLGTSAVCTNPQTCPNEAVQTPAPKGETWHYSIGHWVEDDPLLGDGAFSSPGLFGFYPWIDQTRTWYGIVARYDLAGAIDSITCGRLIRKAWITATVR